MNFIEITGTNNKVDGLDPNCIIDRIVMSGIGNKMNLNQNCSNSQRNIIGLQNIVRINGNQINNSNNQIRNNNMFNRNNNGRIISNNRIITINSNPLSAQYINEINSAINPFGMNFNMNNFNNMMSNMNINVMNDINNNVNYDNNDDNDDNVNNSSDFELKKQQLILEMDEFQFKHIKKYDSRKETECAICLEKFKGIDIIKAFIKCEHIFHKKCLKEWLKTSNCCPLCKHDLSDDII